jgi:hypothetical protein
LTLKDINEKGKMPEKRGEESKKGFASREGFALFHYFLDEEGCWVSFFSPFFLPATFFT